MTQKNLVSYDAIPDELKSQPRWIAWHGEPKPTPTNPDKLNKIPINPNTGYNAKSNDPGTWGSFEDATYRFTLGIATEGRKIDGLSFMLGDGYAGVDLDDCRNPETGEIQDWAWKPIQRFNTYTEISPSDRGVKIFGKVKKSRNRGKRKGNIEVYDRRWQFTVTGNHLEGTPTTINDITDALDELFEELASSDEHREERTRTVTDDDQTLIDKAMAAANGDKFKALWEGNSSNYRHEDGTPDHSRADLALCSHLAFWTQGERERIDRLFRQSGLYRDKWEREDYRNWTIDKALQQAEYYDPNYRSNGRQQAQSDPNGNTRATSPDSSDDFRSVRGVFEGKAYYYRYVKQDDNFVENPISSFLIQPKLRVWLDGKENLTVDLVTSDKTYPDVVIRRRDWNSNERFKDAFPSVDLAWYGGRNDVQAVQKIVASYPVPVKQGTTQLGRQPAGLWILPDGAINTDGFIKEPDLIYLPNGGRGELDNKISIPNPSDDDYRELLVKIYTHLPALNEIAVTIPTIGWFLATPFKPLFSDRYEGFPHLSIWGTRGAGKSTLLRLMWRLAGFKRGLGNKLFSCTETDFVMLRLLSATTSIPVVLDEYKPYDMLPQRHKALTRLLRKAYDGETEFRGKPDQTTVEYNLSAPIAIAGEVALSEGAHLERIVSVEMSPNKLTPVMRRAYRSLQKLPLQAFNSRYIPFCLRTDFDAELEKVEALTRKLIDLDELPDRIQKNLTVMVFGFQQYIRFGIEQGILDEADDVTKDLSEAVLAVKNAVCGENGVTKVALDYMIEHLAVMAETGRLQYNRDYTVRETYGDIVIRFESCFAEFRKYHRETQLSGELLDDKAYRRQIRENLEQKSYITGTNINVKFGKSSKKGVTIDPHRATLLGMDLDGFYGNESNEG